MARVLVVEQGKVARAADLLEAEGFVVVTAIHLAESRTVLETFAPDLVLVEAPLPSSFVPAVCAAIRASGTVPILLLSGPCNEREAVGAFTAGVDSLVLEPVGRHELVARVRALLRRATPEPGSTALDRIVVGPVVLDSARRELSVQGVEIRIPRREFDIAELLMREAGNVVPRQKIVRALWGSVRDTKSLDVQVGRLRARLGEVEGWRRIVTVRGVGFRFLLDVDREFEVDATLTDSADAVVIDLPLDDSDDSISTLDSSIPQLLEGSASQ